MSYEVGQEVIRRSRNSGHVTDRTGTVVRVARKYCTVEFPSHIPDCRPVTAEFDKRTGLARMSGNYSPDSQIKTPEEWAEVDRKRDLTQALRRAGVEVRSNLFTLEQVEAIAAIVGAKTEEG